MPVHAPNVFDADLPTISYDLTATPQDILDDLRSAQSRAPIAIGPLGPEILSYELAREILRDNRFRLPPGITLAAQGITSGPLYDKLTTSSWVWKARHMSGCANWCPRRSLPPVPRRVFPTRSRRSSTD